MLVRPFNIAVADDQIEELHRRLRHTRWPDTLSGLDWDDGTDRAYLQHLVRQWTMAFEWRAEEARLNRLPQFTTTLDGLDIHFVYERGKGPKPLPLLVTHDVWGSALSMERLIPLLTDPAAHGGDAADAFDVIAPITPEEQQFLDNLKQWFEKEGAYHSLQSTKLQTPAYALNDSPTGLAAWMVEKFGG